MSGQSRIPSMPWSRRVIRNLLYGCNVDRAAKARVRVGLVIILFGLIYAVIAARLVIFAAFPDARGRTPHRLAGRDRHGAALISSIVTARFLPLISRRRACSASRAASSTGTRRSSC